MQKFYSAHSRTDSSLSELSDDTGKPPEYTHAHTVQWHFRVWSNSSAGVLTVILILTECWLFMAITTMINCIAEVLFFFLSSHFLLPCLFHSPQVPLWLSRHWKSSCYTEGWLFLCYWRRVHDAAYFTPTVKPERPVNIGCYSACSWT